MHSTRLCSQMRAWKRKHLAQRVGGRLTLALQRDHETFAAFLHAPPVGRDCGLARWQRVVSLCTAFLTMFAVDIMFFYTRARNCCDAARALLGCAPGDGECLGFARGGDCATLVETFAAYPVAERAAVVEGGLYRGVRTLGELACAEFPDPRVAGHTILTALVMAAVGARGWIPPHFCAPWIARQRLFLLLSCSPTQLLTCLPHLLPPPPPAASSLAALATRIGTVRVMEAANDIGADHSWLQWMGFRRRILGRASWRFRCALCFPCCCAISSCRRGVTTNRLRRPGARALTACRCLLVGRRRRNLPLRTGRRASSLAWLHKTFCARRRPAATRRLQTAGDCASLCCWRTNSPSDRRNLLTNAPTCLAFLRRNQPLAAKRYNDVLMCLYDLLCRAVAFKSVARQGAACSGWSSSPCRGVNQSSLLVIADTSFDLPHLLIIISWVPIPFLAERRAGRRRVREAYSKPPPQAATPRRESGGAGGGDPQPAPAHKSHKFHVAAAMVAAAVPHHHHPASEGGGDAAPPGRASRQSVVVTPGYSTAAAARPGARASIAAVAAATGGTQAAAGGAGARHSVAGVGAAAAATALLMRRRSAAAGQDAGGSAATGAAEPRRRRVSSVPAASSSGTATATSGAFGEGGPRLSVRTRPSSSAASSAADSTGGSAASTPLASSTPAATPKETPKKAARVSATGRPPLPKSSARGALGGASASTPTAAAAAAGDAAAAGSAPPSRAASSVFSSLQNTPEEGEDEAPHPAGGETAPRESNRVAWAESSDADGAGRVARKTKQVVVVRRVVTIRRLVRTDANRAGDMAAAAAAAVAEAAAREAAAESGGEGAASFLTGSGSSVRGAMPPPPPLPSLPERTPGTRREVVSVVQTVVDGSKRGGGAARAAPIASASDVGPRGGAESGEGGGGSRRGSVVTKRVVIRRRSALPGASAGGGAAAAALSGAPFAGGSLWDAAPPLQQQAADGGAGNATAAARLQVRYSRGVAASGGPAAAGAAAGGSSVRDPAGGEPVTPTAAVGTPTAAAAAAAKRGGTAACHPSMCLPVPVAKLPAPASAAGAAAAGDSQADPSWQVRGWSDDPSSTLLSD